MSTQPLNVTTQVVLDGAGNGMIGIGPLSAREVWHPSMAHVQCSTQVLQAQCNVYAGDAPEQRCFRDATATGSLGDSTDRISADVLKTPDRIWALWVGGDPGAIATLSVTGTVEL